MEHELIKLCRELINALTKDNYELVKRFVELEIKFEASLPTPEKLGEVPGIGRKPKDSGKTFKPEIAQGKMPWDSIESVQPTGAQPQSDDPLDNLPF
jgi:hypothetical protein